MAAMLCAMGVVALAQEEKAAPENKPGQEQGAQIGELNQKINRMVVEAAQKIPELKALHETQQAKWRDANKKRMEIVAANPEIKKLQEDLDAKRKKEGELREEIIAKNPELAEMKKQLKELGEKFEQKRREVLSASPEQRAAWGAAGRARAEAKHGYATWAAAHEALYREVLPPVS
jgi:chromosome segregation ATPase